MRYAPSACSAFIVGLICLSMSASAQSNKDLPKAIVDVREALNTDPNARENLALTSDYSIETFAVMRYGGQPPTTLEEARTHKMRAEPLDQTATSNGTLSVRFVKNDLEIVVDARETSAVHSEMGFTPPFRVWSREAEIGIFNGGANKAMVDVSGQTLTARPPLILLPTDLMDANLTDRWVAEFSRLPSDLLEKETPVSMIRIVPNDAPAAALRQDADERDVTIVEALKFDGIRYDGVPYSVQRVTRFGARKNWLPIQVRKYVGERLEHELLLSWPDAPQAFRVPTKLIFERHLAAVDAKSPPLFAERQTLSIRSANTVKAPSAVEGTDAVPGIADVEVIQPDPKKR